MQLACCTVDCGISQKFLSRAAHRLKRRFWSMESRHAHGRTIGRLAQDYGIFGAGDDAKPVVHLARELGWFVGVAEGRSHLATRERFRAADVVSVLPIAELPDAAAGHFDIKPTDAAVVMTHSFEQDSRILASLLALEYPLAYLGVLGPQRRTSELLAEAARLLNLPHPTLRRTVAYQDARANGDRSWGGNSGDDRAFYCCRDSADDCGSQRATALQGACGIENRSKAIDPPMRRITNTSLGSG